MLLQHGEVVAVTFKISGKAPVEIKETLFLDKRLSLKAKGLLLLVVAFDSDDSLSIDNLSRKTKESAGAIKSAIDELIKLGYIEKKQVRENGRFGKVVFKVCECAFSLSDYEENPLMENTLTVNKTTEVNTINKNNIIKNNNNTNNTNNTENTRNTSNFDSVSSLNANLKITPLSAVEEKISKELTETQRRYLLSTINNIQSQGKKISNPKSLFAEAEFAILTPSQLKGVTSFKHRVNIISKIIRQNKWTTPKGFSKYSVSGKKIEILKQESISNYLKDKQAEGVIINKKEKAYEMGASLCSKKAILAQKISKLNIDLSTEQKFLSQLEKGVKEGGSWSNLATINSVKNKIDKIKKEIYLSRDIVKKNNNKSLMINN